MIRQYGETLGLFGIGGGISHGRDVAHLFLPSAWVTVYLH